MKVLINTSKLRFGGAVQVALSFIYECRKYSEHQYHVFVGQGVGKSLNTRDFPENFSFYDFDFGVLNLLKSWKIAAELSKYEDSIKPDCVVTTSGPSYWRSKAPHLMGYNLPLYIYRDSPFFSTISFYKKLRYTIKAIIHFYFFRREAAAYFVQTDDVNQRVRKALRTQKVFTVSNTYSSFYTERKNYRLPVPEKETEETWILTLSSYYPHKNLEIIPSVIEELENRGYSNVRFLLTLKETTFQKIYQGLDIHGIYNVGPVKPEECPTLYSYCDYMFLPSLAECFSASYPEAMIMKKPIITSDLSFARSICGNAAMYYKAMDSKAAADAIERLLKDETLRKTMVENGLMRLQKFNTAEERAGKILEICEKLKETS